MLYSLIVMLIFLVIVDRWKPIKFIKLHQQLGIDWTYLPVIGHAYKFGYKKDLINVIDEGNSQAYQRKNGTVSLWICNRLIMGVVDPKQATAVLKISSSKKFIHNFFCHLIGNGTVFAPIDVWHRRRKILAPTFSTRYVSQFIRIFEHNAKILVQKLESKVGQGNFSCWEYVIRYSLDSVCESTLGVQVGTLNDFHHPFFNAYQDYFRNAAIRIARPWLYSNTLFKLFPLYKKQQDNKKIIHELVDNIIYKRRADIMNITNSDATNPGFKTFLELMIESSKETNKGYSHEELREESLVLILAGTDTSAVAICFTAVLLSQHQDVQDKVFKELEEVLGDTNRPIEFEDLLKLKYMDAVINETLRLYPPVPIIVRDLTKSSTLPSGEFVPNGCDVIISILGIHRNPRYWGEDSGDFKPERFLSGEIRVPGSFVPFSYGPRNCIGNLYAMLSMKTTLVTILRQYRLLPATSFIYDMNNPLRISFEIMMKHVDNFEIQIRHRDQEKVATS